MDIKEAFAQRLIELREDKNVTQHVLADDLGITRQSLSLYEKADRAINIELLYKIAKYFNVSTDYLLGLDENPTTNPDIKIACKCTGLSEDAIKKLNDIDNFILRFVKSDEEDYSYIRNGLLIALNDIIEKEFLLYFASALADLFHLSTEWTLKCHAIIMRDGENADIKDECLSEINDQIDLLRYSISRNVERYVDESDGRACLEHEAQVFAFDVLKKKVLEQVKFNGKHNSPEE